AVVVCGGKDPRAIYAPDPQRSSAFTRSMHSISAGCAPALAAAVDLGRARRLLDVGGGSGVHAIALARAWPALECTVWEISSVAALVPEYAARESAPVAARVQARAGDFWKD